jgi:glycosyltransferase involved in cell wall biosynthesis
MRFTIGLPITKIDFLNQTLDSINSQTFKDFEIIIRNNADTENVKSAINKICSSWINAHNVKYFESNNQLKIFDNFNEILKHANGEYFLILSDDDVINPCFLEEFDKLINSNSELDLFHCRVHLINEKNDIQNISPICPQLETYQDFIYHRLKGFRLQFLSDFVVKTEAIRSIGGFPTLPGGWGLDDLTWIMLARKGVAYTSYCGLQYRILNSNFSWEITNLKNRFADNEFLFTKIDQIIKQDTFTIDTDYTNELFNKIVIKWHNKSNRYTLIQMVQTTNILKSIIIFIQFKKEYKLKLTDLIFAFIVKWSKK